MLRFLVNFKVSVFGITLRFEHGVAGYYVSWYSHPDIQKFILSVDTVNLMIYNVFITICLSVNK